jgi:DNA-binding PadR family transcriptional regulator
MGSMDEDEKEIYTYLKTWSGQFVSGREIARRAGGKWRYRDNPNWATPILLRLVEKGLLESDSTGYYRLKPRQKKKSKKWISPQLKAILEKSGRNFGDLLAADERDDM